MPRWALLFYMGLLIRSSRPGGVFRPSRFAVQLVINIMRFIVSFALVLALAACGGGGGSVDVSETINFEGGGSGNPGQPVEPPRNPGEDFRVFRMGAGTVQFLPIENRPLRNGNEDFAIESVRDDLDVITLVADYIGVPFDLFADGMDIPEDHPWTIEARKLIERAQAADKPLLLQLGLVRRAMVGRAIDVDGELEVDLTWAPSCFDFSEAPALAAGEAYIHYATWLSRELQPLYVVNFSEANLYYTNCGRSGAAWDNLVDIQRRAYDSIKAVAPDAIVFSSVALEGLYDDTLDGWDEEQYQDITRMAYDTFAIASYPFGIRKEGGEFVTPYDLPSDYFSRVRDRHPEEKRISISETGWNNVSLAVGDEEVCLDGFPYSESMFVVDYMDFVLNSAHELEFDLLNWFSFRDTMPAEVVSTCYPRTDGSDIENDACMGDFFCQAVNQAKNVVDIPGQADVFSEVVLKAFGAMGLKEYYGDSRDMLFDLWRKNFELPLEHELPPQDGNSAN